MKGRKHLRTSGPESGLEAVSQTSHFRLFLAFGVAEFAAEFGITVRNSMRVGTRAVFQQHLLGASASALETDGEQINQP